MGPRGICDYCLLYSISKFVEKFQKQKFSPHVRSDKKCVIILFANENVLKRANFTVPIWLNCVKIL